MVDFFFDTDLESTVEDTVIAWAENHGWEARFMSYRGRIGCADVFFFGFGEIVMMEFKKVKGGIVSGAQGEEHKRLAAAGTPVYLTNDAPAAIEHLKGFM